MKTISLDSIREAVEAKYGSYDVEYAEGKTVRLLNAIRIDKDKRKMLMDLQSKLKEDGADQAALLADCIRAVADNKARAEELLKAVGGDLAILIELFSEYGKATQVGEASASQEK
jgi:hypothetical protein